jgi:hypothetical protein
LIIPKIHRKNLLLIQEIQRKFLFNKEILSKYLFILESFKIVDYSRNST